MTITVGYDIGGAHLKVAAVEDGRLVLVRQIACPLWQGPEQLDAAFDEAAGLSGAAAVHAVTMTAELTEIFESRQAGVIAILQKARERLRGDIRVFWASKVLVPSRRRSPIRSRWPPPISSPAPA